MFTDAFFPYVSGVVTATANISKGLADRGHKIYIIIPKFKSKTRFKYKNIEIKRVYKRN